MPLLPRPFRFTLFRRYRQFAFTLRDRSSKVARFFRPKLVKISLNKNNYQEGKSKIISSTSSSTSSPSASFPSSSLPPLSSSTSSPLSSSPSSALPSFTSLSRKAFEYLPPREAAARVMKQMDSPNIIQPSSPSPSVSPSSPSPSPPPPTLDSLSTLLPYGSLSSLNHLTIFHDGDEAYSSMFTDILSARHSIHLETYTIKDDAVGQKMISLLIECIQKRGIDVTLIFDSWGSSDMSSLLLGTSPNMISKLVDAGGKAIQFNTFRVPFIGKFLRGFRYFRDHRKILIVDNIVGYTGGMNIGNEYCGIQNGGNGEYRDCQVRIEGPGVIGLSNVFLDSYKEAMKLEKVTTGEWEGSHNIYWERRRERDEFLRKYHEKEKSQEKVKENTTSSLSQSSSPSSPPPYPPYPPALLPSSSIPFVPLPPHPLPTLYYPVTLQVLMANTFRQSRDIQQSIHLAISYAKSHVYITNPYFIPPHSLMQSLQRAADNGVDVRVVMTGGRTDVPWARWGCQYLYSTLLESGVKLYEYEPKTLHAKVITIDNYYSSIGSFNFDRLSWSLNLEVNIATFNTQVAKDLEKQFLFDITKSTEITKSTVEATGMVARALQWIMYRGFSSVFEPVFMAANERFKWKRESVPSQFMGAMVRMNNRRKERKAKRNAEKGKGEK